MSIRTMSQAYSQVCMAEDPQAEIAELSDDQLRDLAAWIEHTLPTIGIPQLIHSLVIDACANRFRESTQS